MKEERRHSTQHIEITSSSVFAYDILMAEREQPAPGVTAEDIRRWLDVDRARLERLRLKRTSEPSELLEAEIEMVAATIGQFEAELRYLALCERDRSRAQA